MVILCVPVGVMSYVTEKISPYLSRSVIVSDVGSVKESVVVEVQKKLPKGVFFVPAHPLAGTENSGPSSGFATLFENRYCIITPSDKIPLEIIKKVRLFWEKLGSNVIEMEAKHHDLVLSVTSHAPHLIAFAMVGVADDFSKVTNSEVINYSAAGFRDFTRLAASDPVMWRDIFLDNNELVIEAINKFSENLDEFKKAIIAKDNKKLLEILQAFANTGNTVVVIEHNLDVIKTADHIIDMGPEGGINGGRIIAEGTPEKVSQVEQSYTGRFIRELLGNSNMKKTA